jgi:hypothetical protein
MFKSFRSTFKLISLYLFSSLCISAPSLKETLMNPEKLHSIISDYSSNVTINNNVISFDYEEVTIYCIWDANADRMRMISPIAKTADLSSELLELALKANYHTVLDARYAIGDDVLYSAFIHPLSPITKNEIESAIRQVSTSALTFGTSFTSGELVFPGNKAEQAKKGKSQSM